MQTLSHQIRKSHEVAERVHDGAGDEVPCPDKQEGGEDAEDGGVRKLKNWDINMKESKVELAH
jgi:hypothetical protein